MTMVEERKYKKKEVCKDIDESPTDRDFVKRYNITFKSQEDEKFAKVINTTNLGFEEEEKFDRLFNNTTIDFEEDGEFDEMFNNNARESFTNEFEEHENEYHTDKLNEEDEEFDRLINNITFNFEKNGELDEVFGNIARGSFINEFEEEEEFAEVFYTTNFEFEETKKFDKMFINTTFDFKGNDRFDKKFDVAKGSFTSEFKERLTW